MTRYVCIHGHFYQPPRENPWLEEIEIQDSAYPYHDWNERISIECYSPNAASRILNHEHKIVNIVNNYARMSYNFGPTLLSWLEKKIPDAYAMIVDADRESRQNFSGHGAALAQVYNHMIMPLANARDKRTQIIWGMRDFEHRFKRKPEGMWLAETAVDTETLELMAEQGIAFTILSPYQAKAVRRFGAAEWQDVNGGRIDPKQAYQCLLPSGRRMALFFYDGPIARDIAFGGLLNNGEQFANRLMSTFTNNGDVSEAQLVHIATDGETYGHHHGFGEMALSYCQNYIQEQKLARITIYAEFLEKVPPVWEVQIHENSSWSCCHGVERWRDKCGCNTGGENGWTQEWRRPLREAMDWLRDRLAQIFETEMAGLGIADAWAARDAYIAVVLDRRPEVQAELLRQCGRPDLSGEQQVRLLKLLEMQRQAMLMYTSCGWFFSEVSGLETVQIMQYAARAMQLCRNISGQDLEPEYLSLIQQARSNIEQYGNAARVYRKFIKPSMLDLHRVGAHYAVSSLFHDYDEQTAIYCYTIKRHQYERRELGRHKVVIGQAHVRSTVTGEQDTVSFAVFHFGDHNLLGGVNDSFAAEQFDQMSGDMIQAFERSDISEISTVIDRYFGEHTYSFWYLFRDEQRRVLSRILTSTMKEIEASFRQVNEHHYPVMRVMREAGLPLPKVFATTLAFIHNTDILELLRQDDIDIGRLESLVAAVREWGLEIDRQLIGFVASRRLEAAMQLFARNTEELEILSVMRQVFEILQPLNLPLRLWNVQNNYFEIGRGVYPGKTWRAKKGDAAAQQWVECFDALSEHLRIKNI